MRNALIISLLCLKITGLAAQAPASSDSVFSKKKTRWFAVPVVFYTPDTRWGFGASGVSSFQFDEKSPRSSLTFGGAYTTRKQLLVYLPFKFFMKKNQLRAYGEVGYFRYVFQYFGIGNAVPNDFLEKYDARFPRIRLNFGKKISPNLFVGPRFSFDQFKITKHDPVGLLVSEKPVGWDGGRLSSLGLFAQFDSRDGVFSPTKGWLTEVSFQQDGRFSGSDFRFGQFFLDAARYLSVGKKSTLAIQIMAQNSWGEVPFFQMATLGGTKKMRGYFDGKYRDRNLFLAQSEFRFSIWKRVGGVVFAGAGTVFGGDFIKNGTKTGFFDLRPDVGAGLRFAIDPVQKLNIRLDFGLGEKGQHGFYLTFGEAF